MADLVFITRNILGSGNALITGEDPDYPAARLYDRDKNEICKFATYDLMDGDVLDEDCSAIPGSDPAWTDNSAGDGAASAAGGKFNLDGGSAGAGNYAQLDAALGAVIRTAANFTTIEIALNHTTLGTLANVDYLETMVKLSDNLTFRARWATDGLYIRGASADKEVGVDVVSTGSDIIWRFAITHEIEQLARVNVYKDGSLVAWGVDCAYYSAGTWTEGDIRLTQRGDNTANTETDIDYIYIDADLIPGLIEVEADQSDDPKSVDIAIIEGHNWNGQPVAIKYFEDTPASILNEPCTSETIGNWTDGDATGGGGAGAESRYEEFDGQTCFRFYGGSAAGSGTYAYRSRSLGDVFTNGKATIELRLYPHKVGQRANNDYFEYCLYLTSGLRLQVGWTSEGLKIRDSSGWNEVGGDLVVQEAWGVWRFVVDWRGGAANATCNVYKDSELVAEYFPCNQTGSYTAGDTYIWCGAYNNPNSLVFVDYLKLDGELVEWADFTTPWVPSDNSRLVKTAGSAVTAPLWKVTAGELPGLLMDEKCVSYSSPYTWNDLDAGDGASTEEIGVPGTYDRVFKFHGGSAGAGNYARRVEDFGDIFGIQTTVEIEVYLDNVGTRVNNDDAWLIIHLSSTCQWFVRWASDGLFRWSDSTGYAEIGTNLTRTGVLQKWRFVINHEIEHEAVMDVYLDDVLVALDVTCEQVLASTAGRVDWRQRGDNTANTLTYFKNFKMDDGLIPPWQGDITSPRAAEITLGLRGFTKGCGWPGPSRFGREPNISERFSTTGHRWAAKRGESRWFSNYELRGLSAQEESLFRACLTEIDHFKSFYIYDHEGQLRLVQLAEPAALEYLTKGRINANLSLMEVS